MQVIRGQNESTEALIRRFSKRFQRSGIMQELRAREGFVGPAEKRRLKRKRAVARAIRESQREIED